MLNLNLIIEQPIRLDIKAQSNARVIGLLGDSGVGKTSLLRSLAGLNASHGTIEMTSAVNSEASPQEHPAHRSQDLTGHTQELQNLATDHLAIHLLATHQRPIAMVAQQPQLLPHWTLAQQLERVRAKAFSQLLNLQQLISDCQCQTLLEKYPRQLSGGQRQRAALLLALAREPKLLLLDEAFSGLDRRAKRQLFHVLTPALTRLNAQALLVSHQLQDIQALADDCWLLEDGQISQQGAMVDVLKHYQRHDGQYSNRSNAYSAVITAQFLGYNSASDLAEFNIGSGQRVFAQGPYQGPKRAKLAINSDELALSLNAVGNTSFANCFKVQVNSFDACDYGARVFVQTDATNATVNETDHNEPAELAVQITRASLSNLPISPGQSLYALAKASAIVVL